MATNSQAIAQALPPLIAAERKLSDAAAAWGIVYAINAAEYGAIRSPVDTTKAMTARDREYPAYVAGGGTLAKETWRKIAPFGQSYHNYGAAFDVVIVQHLPAMTVAQSLAALGKLAPAFGLKWGGTFNDPAHFELAIPLSVARKEWETLGNTPGFSIVKGAGTVAIVFLLWLAARRFL